MRLKETNCSLYLNNTINSITMQLSAKKDQQNLRHPSIDILRGWIIIWMALDHCSGMIGRMHFMEMWGVPFKGYPDLAWWFTRFISHLCAPGFFFLMGMSIFFFAHKSLSNGKNYRNIFIYFLKRAGLIIGLMYFLEFPAWGLSGISNQIQDSGGFNLPGDYTGGFLLPSTVLYGLASCMVLGGWLFRLKNYVLLALSIICISASHLIIGQMENIEQFNPFLIATFVPGATKGIMTLYPTVPWLSVCLLGIIWARLMKSNPDKIYQWSLISGIAFVIIAVILRWNKILNIHFNEYSGFIDFFTINKYPPSLVFILITCGINFIFLFLFNRIENNSMIKPLKIFGATAMFFYIVHLWLFGLLSFFFPTGTKIYWMYLVWLLALFPLFYMCKSYLKFKKSKDSDSIWRMI